jgi:hypothetical protein
VALQLDVTTRNARLDATEASIGASPHLFLRTGPPPANVGLPPSGTLICDITLPADWMAAASAGTKTKLGLWQALAIADGVLGHYRIIDSLGAVRLQGTVTVTGGGGDMTVDSLATVTNQLVTVTSYIWTEANA